MMLMTPPDPGAVPTAIAGALLLVTTIGFVIRAAVANIGRTRGNR